MGKEFGFTKEQVLALLHFIQRASDLRGTRPMAASAPVRQFAL
jgi:hypothetical protein